MDNEQNKYIPPKPTAGDTIHTIVRAGFSAIPVAGGAVVELFNAIIVPPINERREEWMKNVSDGLKSLEEKVEGFSIESLSEDESFVTTLMHASQVAIQNHQQEKLDALRNAVFNSALLNAPGADMQMIFLQLVDSLTVLHLQVLKLLDNPLEWAEARGIKYPSSWEVSETTLLEFALPELKGQYALIDLITTELRSRGLIITSHWVGNLPDCLSTGIGQGFLSFITEPKAMIE